MMAGMALLLRQLGIDPDTIQQTVSDTAKAAVEARDALVRVEAKLDRVLAPPGAQPDATQIEANNGTER